MELSGILEKAQNGDAEAFAILYNRVNDKNYKVAQYYMKNEQDSFDVLQDSYIKIYENLTQFRGNTWESFGAWTKKIIRNTALNHLKARRVIVFSDLMEKNVKEDGYEYDMVDESEASQPDLVLEKKEAAETIRIMLSGLSEEQRICVLMYYMEQMSTTEIAKEIGCSVNTVKSRLGYARKHIQKQEPLLRKKGVLVSGVVPILLLACAFQSEMISAHMKPQQVKQSNRILKEVLHQKHKSISRFSYQGAKLVLIKKCLVGVVAVSVVVGIMPILYHGIKTNSKSTENLQQVSKPNKIPPNTKTNVTTPKSTLQPKETKRSKKTPQPKKKETSKPIVAKKPEKKETSKPIATKKSKEKEISKPIVTKKPKEKVVPKHKDTQKPKTTKKPEKTEDTTEWDEDYTDWE